MYSFYAYSCCNWYINPKNNRRSLLLSKSDSNFYFRKSWKRFYFWLDRQACSLTRFALFHENGEIMTWCFNVWYKTCLFIFDVRVLSFKRQWKNLQKTVGKILQRNKLPWFLIRSAWTWCRSNLFSIHWQHSKFLAILASWVAEVFPYSSINLWKKIL